MAFYTDPNADKDEEQEGGMNAPIATSTQTASITPGTAGNIATQQVKAPKVASSGMTGFNQFAKANQGTAQNRLNSSATQNVQNVGQQANNAISQATTSFGQKVDAGSLKDRQNAVSDVANITNAARNVSAPVVPQPQVSGGAIPQVSAPQTLPAPGLDQNQQNRFQEVINSKYQGPESLRQSGLYQVASGKVQGAQNALNQTKTAGGREDLLKTMNAQRGDYSTGLNKLDAALLNSNKQGVSQLQSAAQAQGNVEQKLDQAQIGSANLAQNRGNEIRGIQDQARNEFTQGQAAERAATDERLSQVVADWDKLPEHFREILRNQATGNVNLNSFEAGVLGVGQGEGLYKLGENAIASGVSDKNKLITRDEQTRQAVLAQLAGLDQQKRLDTNMVYDKADMAGTQTALDALDLEQTRKNLNEAEQSFRDTAENTNLTGEGMKKVSRGNAAGKKTKKFYATASGNAGDFLENAGYDLDAKLGQGQTPADGQRLLQAALERTSTKRQGNANQLDNDKVLSGAAKGGATGAAIGSVVPGVGTGVGASVGTALGAVTSAGTVDTVQMYSDLLRGFGGPAEAVGKGIQDVRQGAKDVYDDTYGKLFQGVGLDGLGKGIGGMIGGIDSGAMKKLGDSVANQNAVEDLKNKYTGFLDNQGFNNRVGIADNDATTQRMTGLQSILDQIDKNKG